MKKLLIPLIASPLIYLVIATTLVLIPVERYQSDQSLDFGALDLTAVSDVQAIERSFTARDGKNIFYRYIPGESSIVIILLHGSGTEGRYLIPLAERLNSSLGVTVVIPDLRGHGHSALSHLGDIDYLGQYEDDLEDMNLALRSTHLNSTIILGGHSSGGGLAVKYGGSTLKEFDGYLLLAPYLGYQAPTVRPNSGGWVQVSQRRYAGLAMLNNVGITGLNGYPVLFFNRPHKFADQFQADSYSYRLNESFSPQAYSDNLRANEKPILVMVGQNDEVFYVDKFESVFSENAPHAELSIVAGMKHLNLPSSQMTADLIVKWVEKSYREALPR